MPPRRVVVTDYKFPSLGAEAAAAEAFGATFEAYQCTNPAEVVAAGTGANVVVVQASVFGNEAVAAMAPDGTIIRYGAGYDNVDVAAAAARGIRVAYVPDYCTDEVADHTATALLALLRKLAVFDASVRAGHWNAVAAGRPIRPFSETLVGFVGLGRIGRAVMARLRPFGFSFEVFDPYLAPDSISALGATASSSLSDLAARVDAMTLHAPSSPQTRHLINADVLSRMKPTAVLVNAARGDLIDGEALGAALRAGRIRAAALDVFEREPLPPDSPLRSLPNLHLSPHAAWYSDASMDRLQALAADEIRRALQGLPPRCPVPAPRAAPASELG